MKKIIYLLVLVFCSGAVLVSCDKDDDTKSQEKKFVPIKITEYEGDYVEDETLFEYDVNNKLIKREYDEYYYETFEYDTEGRLNKMKTYEDNSLFVYDTYEYNNSDQVIKIQSYNNEDEARSYYIHEYDTEGNVVKKTKYSADGTLVEYYTYSHDSNGNIINEKYYWADYTSGVVSTDQYEEWTYTYDDKNNVYKSVNLPFMWESTVNNPLTTIFTEHYGDNYTDTYTNVYEYNEDNYPTEYSDVDDGERYVIEYKEI